MKTEVDAKDFVEVCKIVDNLLERVERLERATSTLSYTDKFSGASSNHAPN
jgi:hypothetical protein